MLPLPQSSVAQKNILTISEKREILDRLQKSVPDDAIIDEYIKRNFEIDRKILDKIKSEIDATNPAQSSKIKALKDEVIPEMAQALIKEFKKDPEELKNFIKYLKEESLLNKAGQEKIEKIIADESQEQLKDLLSKLSLKDLLVFEQGHGLGIITEEKLDSIFADNKKYFKLTFDKNGKEQITELEVNNIWGNGGLDKSRDVILINPGNGPANAMTQITDRDNFLKGIAYEAKLFKKGNSQNDTQYLIAINERMGAGNFKQIRSHNQASNPETFITERARKQVEAIYGPLIQQDGVKLSDEEITENLSKMKSFNCSFGTITANCQENALRQYMQELGIVDSVIKKAMNSMQRLDMANIALHSSNQDLTSTRVVIQGSNDELAKKYGANQNLPANGATQVGDNIVILSPQNPEEVYSPWKKLSDDDKKRDAKIHEGFAKINEKLEKEKSKKKERGRWEDALIVKTKEMRAERNLQKDLESQGLDGARFKDSYIHSPPHYTMDAISKKEAEGRDPNNIYKAMEAMMKSESSQEFLRTATTIFTAPSPSIKPKEARLTEGADSKINQSK